MVTTVVGGIVVVAGGTVVVDVVVVVVVDAVVVTTGRGVAVATPISSFTDDSPSALSEPVEHPPRKIAKAPAMYLHFIGSSFLSSGSRLDECFHAVQEPYNNFIHIVCE